MPDELSPDDKVRSGILRIKVRRADMLFEVMADEPSLPETATFWLSFRDDNVILGANDNQSAFARIPLSRFSMMREALEQLLLAADEMFNNKQLHVDPDTGFTPAEIFERGRDHPPS